MKPTTFPVAPVESEIVNGELPETVSRELFAMSKSVPAPPAMVNVLDPDAVRVAFAPLMRRSRAIVSEGTELIDGAEVVLPSITNTSFELVTKRGGIQFVGM